MSMPWGRYQVFVRTKMMSVNIRDITFMYPRAYLFMQFDLQVM